MIPKIISLIVLCLFVLGAERILVHVAQKWGEHYLEELSDQPERWDQSLPLYSSDGQWIGTVGDHKSFFVSIQEVPQHVVQAVLAAEDHRFFSHKGVSYIGILRATWNNLFKGDSLQGASTITQQLVRIRYLKLERTWDRKIKEACMALALEKKLTKYEILEDYLNRVFLGQSAYGIEAASRNYFRKSVRDLSIAESAMIAGIIPAPSVYNPHRNLAMAEGRKIRVIGRMKELGWLSNSKVAIEEDVRIVPPMPLRSYAPFFNQRVENVIQAFPTTDPIAQVFTTYLKDPNAHRLKRLKEMFKNASVAYVRLDKVSGAVRNLESAQDFSTSQFDYAASAQRPLGTAIVPFIVAMALDRGMTLDQSIFEERKIDELHSLKRALLDLRLEDLARVFAWFGAGTFEDFFYSAGFRFPRNKGFRIALGQGLSHALELAAAFRIFLNEGEYNKPFFVEKLRFATREDEYFNGGQSVSILKARTAQMMVEVLGLNGSWHQIFMSRDHRDLWAIAGDHHSIYTYWIGVDEGKIPGDEVGITKGVSQILASE